MPNHNSDNIDKHCMDASHFAPGVPLVGKSAPWLAPLAGHTDLVFRVLCRELGAAVTCTEMVSAKGLIYGERSRKGSNNTIELLQTLRLALAESGNVPNAVHETESVMDSGAESAATDDNPAAIVARARSAEQMRGQLLVPDDFPARRDADSPLVVQLFGDEPEFLGQSVALLRRWGFEWFDLNLGCSVPKVTRSGAGAALARDLDKTLEAARLMIREAGELDCGVAVSPTSSLFSGQSGMAGLVDMAGLADMAGSAGMDAAPVRGRVGFKIRLGWSASEENYLDLAKGLEQCGAAWLTLHPRYARQSFSGTADWSALARLRKAVSIPVMASGDLFDAAAALRCLDESGVDGAMFARGALHTPAIFADYLALLRSDRAGAGLGNCSLGQTLTEELSELNRGARLAELVGSSGQVESSMLEPEQMLRRAEFLRRIILRHAELAKALPVPDKRLRREVRKERPSGSLLKMRGAIPRYVKELPGSRAFRVAMSHCSSWDEFYELVEDFFAAVRSEVVTDL